MHRRFLIVSSLALGAALLLGGGISRAVAKDAEVASLTPQSGWSVTRIGEKTDAVNSYCALSRQYDQNFVLTLGRNAAEEYSLAIDFQKAELSVDKSYSITLQPGPGQIRAYEMMPASNQALVVRLGYDESFFKALEKSELLKVQIDEKKYNFKTSDFTSGRADLQNCWQGLKGGSATKVATGFSTEKVTDATLINIVKAKVVKEVKDVKKAVEAVKADIVKAEPRIIPAVPVRVPNPIEVAPRKIEVTKVVEPVKATLSKIEMPTVTAPIVKDDALAIVSKVSKAPAKSIQISRVEPTPTKIASAKIEMPKVVVPEVKVPKIEASKAVIEIVPKVETKAVKPIEIKRVSSLIKEDVEPKAVKINNEMLSKRSAVSKRVAGRSFSQVKTKTTWQKKGRGDLAPIKAESVQPYKAPKVEEVKVAVKKEVVKAVSVDLGADDFKSKTVMTKNPAKKIPRAPDVSSEVVSKKDVTLKNVVAVDPKATKALKDLKAENTRLSSALQGKDERLSTLEAKAPEAESKLEKALLEIDELEDENKLLYREAREARGNIDTAVIQAGTSALRRIREYEKRIESSRVDNMALLKEVDELRRLKEDNRLGSVGGDVKLETSMRRYNEAEREIKRLGLLLEQQRMSHRQEKEDLEQMLFDPAVTDREQRRRLSDLEQQLADAQKKLKNRNRSEHTRVIASAPVLSEKVSSVPRAPVEKRVSTDLKNTAVRAVSAPLSNPSKNAQVSVVKSVRAVSKAIPSPVSVASVYNVRRSERVDVPVAPTIVAQQRDNLEIQRLNKTIERQNQQLQVYSRRRVAEKEKVIVSSLAAVTAQPLPVRNRPAVSSSVRSPQPVALAPQRKIPAFNFGKSQLQNILNRSGVSVTGPITQQSAGRYRWSAGRLTGQAQIVSKASVGSVNLFAQNYIAKARQSCGGDFASLPASVSGSKEAYEIACVSGARSTSSSVVFTQKGNDIIAIAHEASMDDMDAAMDARDRVAGNL